MFDFLSFKKTISDVRHQFDSLVRQSQEKRAEITRLHTAPLHTADLAALFDHHIDVMSANYGAALEHNINLMTGAASNQAARLNGVRVVMAAPPGMAASFNTIEASICALLGAELKTSIRRRINEMSRSEKAGPLLKDRPALIAAAERELAGLESDLADLRRQAAEAGVTF